MVLRYPKTQNQLFVSFGAVRMTPGGTKTKSKPGNLYSSNKNSDFYRRKLKLRQKIRQHPEATRQLPVLHQETLHDKRPLRMFYDRDSTAVQYNGRNTAANTTAVLLFPAIYHTEYAFASSSTGTAMRNIDFHVLQVVALNRALRVQ